jgi:3-hydroxymyristoyl/3-hydroxydecanoyl-(acyl carrier protein) dehydratase
LSTATIDVPSGGAYFEGHFPGRPILPAVAEIALMVEALPRTTDVESLCAIPFMRLRQLVLPGDRLQLSTGADMDRHVRVELKRDGTLVANGVLVIGNPQRLEASAPATGSCSADAAPLDTLLPHRPPMRFVTSILEETEHGMTCAARIPAACALVAGDSAPAVTALEAGAQTAAAWEATRRWREGGDSQARVGYLVALRDIVFFAARVPADETLVASVRLTAIALPLTHYAVEVRHGTALVLRGTIATFLTDQRID